MRFVLVSACLALAACAAPPPELDARISAEARAADYPALISLTPFDDIDALLPEDRDRTALGLQARAADLRRRAAVLRDLPIN